MIPDTPTKSAAAASTPHVVGMIPKGGSMHDEQTEYSPRSGDDPYYGDAVGYNGGYSPRSGDDPAWEEYKARLAAYSPRSGDDPYQGAEWHVHRKYSPRSGDDPYIRR